MYTNKRAMFNEISERTPHQTLTRDPWSGFPSYTPMFGGEENNLPESSYK